MIRQHIFAKVKLETPCSREGKAQTIFQLNIKQNDFEIIDFELEGIENAINIIQAQ